MGEQKGIHVDAGVGIEYRAVATNGRGGWHAQWRPLRAMARFMTFSFITRSEEFSTSDEALEFVRSNAVSIVTGEL